MATALDIAAALKKKSGFDLVSHHPAANQLRMVGRVPSDAMNVNIHNWLSVVHHLLVGQEAAPWKADVSKQYFLKGAKGSQKVIYGWRLILQGEDITSHYEDILRTILDSKPTSAGELTEYPLPGATADRNTGKNGKGANTIREGGR